MAANVGTTGTITTYPVEYLEALDEVLMHETYASRYGVQGAEFVRNRQVSVPDITFPEAEGTPHDYDRFKTDDKFTLSRTVYELPNDKQATFYVDSCDSIDESAASLNGVVSQWMRMIFMPYIDKDFFKVAAEQAANTAEGAITTANVKAELRKARTAFRKVGLAGADLYITSDALAALEDATERHWANEGNITDTIGSYDGFTVFEVPDDTLGEGVNFIAISGGTNTIRYITKRAFSALFPSGTHTNGDGDLGQYRWVFGTIVRKNRKPGIYVSKEGV